MEEELHSLLQRLANSHERLEQRMTLLEENHHVLRRPTSSSGGGEFEGDGEDRGEGGSRGLDESTVSEAGILRAMLSVQEDIERSLQVELAQLKEQVAAQNDILRKWAPIILNRQISSAGISPTDAHSTLMSGLVFEELPSANPSPAFGFNDFSRIPPSGSQYQTISPPPPPPLSSPNWLHHQPKPVRSPSSQTPTPQAVPIQQLSIEGHQFNITTAQPEPSLAEIRAKYISSSPLTASFPSPASSPSQQQRHSTTMNLKQSSPQALAAKSIQKPYSFMYTDGFAGNIRGAIPPHGKSSLNDSNEDKKGKGTHPAHVHAVKHNYKHHSPSHSHHHHHHTTSSSSASPRRVSKNELHSEVQKILKDAKEARAQKTHKPGFK